MNTKLFRFSLVAAGVMLGCAGQASAASYKYSFVDLGTQGVSSSANAINNVGQVAGYSYTAPNVFAPYHATLWNGTTATDLNSFLDGATVSAGWVLGTATGINDSGSIVGNATNSLTGVSHAFVLTIVPVGAVPEPEQNAMLLAGLVLIGFVARRKNSV